MRKAIILAWTIVCLLCMTACGRHKESGEEIQDIIGGKSYIYEKGIDVGEFRINMNDDGTFDYHEGGYSSYLGMGKWALEGNIIVLSDHGAGGGTRVNRFKLDGEDLVFLSEGSDNFIYTKVCEGERFTQNSSF